jgi:Zn-dependent protease
MPGSLTIGRIRGIPIRLHFTFLLILPLIAWWFSRAFVQFRDAVEVTGIPAGAIPGAPLLWGIGIALALFASVLVHELAHSLYALRRGGQVRDITLFMIGGVSSITEAPARPRHEAVMALVGPLASLGLGVGFLGLHVLLAGTELYSVRFLSFYLGAINVALGIFNLLPAFPMDGGRILRAALVPRIGMARATRAAATLGKVLAGVFVVVAFLTLNFLLMLIGFFVYLGAEAEARTVIAKTTLDGLRVSDLQRPAPAPISSWTAAAEAAARMVEDRRLALLVMDGDALLGIVALEDLERVPPDRRGARIGEIMREAPQVAPAASAWEAFRLMSERRLPTVPVVDDGRVVGVLDQDDITRVLRLGELERSRRASPVGGRQRERTAW